jgi:hypothetical protein
LQRKRVTDKICDVYWLGASQIYGRIGDAGEKNASLIRKVTLFLERVTDKICDVYWLGASQIYGRIGDAGEKNASLIRKVTVFP